MTFYPLLLNQVWIRLVLIKIEHVVLVACADLQPFFELPVFRFELCCHCRDDRQVPFIELSLSVVVLPQNICCGLQRSGVAPKLFLSIFKLLRFPFVVDLPAFGYEFLLFSLVRSLFSLVCRLAHLL